MNQSQTPMEESRQNVIASNDSGRWKQYWSPPPELSKDTSPVPDSWIFVDAMYLGDRCMNIYVFQDESGKWRPAKHVYPVSKEEICDLVSSESDPDRQ